MNHGTIVRLLSDRGFGFVRADHGPEFFFHAKQCFDLFHTLQVGDRVSFDVADGHRGPAAVDVERLSA